MDDARGLRQQRRQITVERHGQAPEPIHHTNRLIGRRGGGFGEGHASGVVYCDQIGKRAADIDAYAIHEAEIQLERGAVCKRRSLGFSRARGKRGSPVPDMNVA